MSNIVAIVGRPNVGKSTLFNRLTESRRAIVDEQSGVTRDRQYGFAEWNGKRFSVIDTGGYVHGSEDIFEGEIRKQVEIAIDEANVILFVVDVEMGITDLDDTVAKILRKSGKNIFLVANKVDNSERSHQSAEFYKFGLGEPYTISSISGSGTGELLDDIVKEFPKDVKDPYEGLPKFAIVGQPNVGKSSLLNMLTGEERSIVTPIAGTTRDPINQRYSKYGHDFVLVDTAGIRKKARVHEDLEFYSVIRAIKAMDEARRAFRPDAPADQQHLAVPLRQIEKQLRRDLAQLRVRPAQQCLIALDPERVGVSDRLIGEVHLAAFDCALQIVRQPPAQPHLLLQPLRDRRDGRSLAYTGLDPCCGSGQRRLLREALRTLD